MASTKRTFRCPHCRGIIDPAGMMGSIVTPKKLAALRKNSLLGGRPKSKNPVRLRPYHPGHPDHQKWLDAQQKKSPQ